MLRDYEEDIDMINCLDDREGLHRLHSCEELEQFVRGGWENFTVRPHGSTEWIHITEELFDKGIAELSRSNFKDHLPATWYTFRDLMTAASRNQVCVPGSLTAHDKAQLAIGIIKCLDRIPPVRVYTNHISID
jgi:hypothetical protein